MVVNILEIFSVILFFSLIAIRLFLKRKEIKVEKVLVFEYSKKYTNKINEVVKNNWKIFTILGTLSLISSPILTLIGVYYIIYSIVTVKPTVALVLPTVSGFEYPGAIISVPFWIWLIAIFVIVLSHESMHALIAAREGVKTRKYGLLYLLVIPIGAFVDIDERKMSKLDLRRKIKILAAGSFGNILVFSFFLLLLIVSVKITSFLFESKGVSFDETIVGSPAHEVGLKGIIIKIDNRTINNLYDLKEFLASVKPNTSIIVETTEGNFNLTLSEKNGNPYIGIQGVKNYIVYRNTDKVVPSHILFTITQFIVILQWLSFLNLGVAIANMLPIIPLDGGLIIREILQEKFGRKGEKLSRYISLSFLILLFFSLFLSSLTLRAAS